MRVVRQIRLLAGNPSPVVTVGSFDGLHLGHQAIIAETVNRTRALQGTSMLVTFEPHPQCLIDPGRAPFLLTTTEEKLEILGPLGIDVVCIIPFTETFHALSAREFVQTILVEGIGAAEIIVGENHAFGRDRQGHLDTLRDMAPSHFQVRVVDPVLLHGQRVSSSRIREMIARGDMRTAADMLGRLYSFGGHVVRGRGYGRRLHVPTANLECDHPGKMRPADGVYAIRARYGDMSRAGMMNIGCRPTFPGAGRSIEVHLFDVHEDLYGHDLRIDVVERVREEQSFNDAEQLMAQMEKDRSHILTLVSGAHAYSKTS